MKKLAIVIPNDLRDVKYIDRAFRVIDGQKNVSFEDIEVIVPTVISNAPTYQPCNFDAKIIYEHKLLRPGKARDLGILNSEAEWIFFHDSDDHLNGENGLRDILKTIGEHENEPCIAFHYLPVDLLSGKDQTTEINRDEKYEIFTLCTKRETIESLGLSFPDTLFSEDRAWTAALRSLLDHDPPVLPVTPYVHYYHQKDSLTSVYNIYEKTSEFHMNEKRKAYEYYFDTLRDNEKFMNLMKKDFKKYGIEI